jgi:DNA-binding response OmpR family regulator
VAAVLVVEDDAVIGQALETGLRAHRHDVRWVRTGMDAVAAADTGSFDLVLLDLGLPDRDGIEVCRALRERLPGCVIVILTARDEEVDVVVGLEAGADDYLTKPFRLAELAARIRAHLRRRAPHSSTAPVARVGRLVVDAAARRAWLGEEEIALRAKEFDLLARLATEPGTLVSRETLMSDVWDENWFGSTKTLDVHIASVRAKLGAVTQPGGDPVPRIVTLRGRGYRLDTE